MGLFDNITSGLVASNVQTAASRMAQTASRNTQGILTNYGNNALLTVRQRVSTKLDGFTRSMIPRSSNPIVNSITGAMNNQISGALNGVLSSAAGMGQGIIGDGVNQIFNYLGLSQNTPIARSNPSLYTAGVGAAKNVASQIITARALPRISDYENLITRISNSGVEPLAALTVAHNDYDQSTSNAPNMSEPYPPYAMDLFRLAPKSKFLFVVEFVFNGGYDAIGKNPNGRNDFAMVVQEFDRPRIKYDYEDDVNYYNFRTKVIKKTTHENLTLKFLDDRENLAMTFFHKYLKETHPVTNIPGDSAYFYEQSGMDWNGQMNSSSTRVLENNLNTIIKEIRVYHLYDFGVSMNVYHFINPKIVNIALDGWSMSESEGNHITADFAYDALYMELGQLVGTTENDRLRTLSDTGHYPMQPVGSTSTGETSPLIPRALSI